MGLLSKLLKQDKNKPTDTIEAIIKTIENKPYGVSQSNVLFAGFDEIGGYYLLKTIVVGRLNIKVKRGAQISLKTNSEEFQFTSDSLEFESEPTATKGRYTTYIDFQIEKEDMDIIQKANISNMTIATKKKTIDFERYHEQ